MTAVCFCSVGKPPAKPLSWTTAVGEHCLLSAQSRSRTGNTAVCFVLPLYLSAAVCELTGHRMMSYSPGLIDLPVSCASTSARCRQIIRLSVAGLRTGSALLGLSGTVCCSGMSRDCISTCSDLQGEVGAFPPEKYTVYPLSFLPSHSTRNLEGPKVCSLCTFLSISQEALVHVPMLPVDFSPVLRRKGYTCCVFRSRMGRAPASSCCIFRESLSPHLCFDYSGVSLQSRNNG